jgi:hypothetical protein
MQYACMHVSYPLLSSPLQEEDGSDMMHEQKKTMHDE